MTLVGMCHGAIQGDNALDLVNMCPLPCVQMRSAYSASLLRASLAWHPTGAFFTMDRGDYLVCGFLDSLD